MVTKINRYFGVAYRYYDGGGFSHDFFFNAGHLTLGGYSIFGSWMYHATRGGAFLSVGWGGYDRFSCILVAYFTASDLLILESVTYFSE